MIFARISPNENRNGCSCCRVQELSSRLGELNTIQSSSNFKRNSNRDEKVLDRSQIHINHHNKVGTTENDPIILQLLESLEKSERGNSESKSPTR